MPETPREKVGLPMRPFFFTLDQIAVLLNLTESHISSKYIYFDGRTTGTRSVHRMIARNIAPPGEKPEWRIAERELIRWMKLKRFRVHEVGVVTN